MTEEDFSQVLDTLNELSKTGTADDVKACCLLTICKLLFEQNKEFKNMNIHLEKIAK